MTYWAFEAILLSTADINTINWKRHTPIERSKVLVGLFLVLKPLWGIVAKCTDSVGKRRREEMPTGLHKASGNIPVAFPRPS